MNEKKIEECYGEFTETLSQVYENLKKTYSLLALKVADSRDYSGRHDDYLDFPLSPKDLEFKGLESFMQIESEKVNQKLFQRP